MAIDLGQYYLGTTAIYHGKENCISFIINDLFGIFRPGGHQQQRYSADRIDAGALPSPAVHT